MNGNGYQKNLCEANAEGADMKKKILTAVLAICLAASLAACGGKENDPEITAAVAETEEESAETKEISTEITTEITAENQEEDQLSETTAVTIRVGSLSGPTSMGLVKLMEDAKNGETEVAYDFTIATAADEITTALIQGDLDIALIPANVASVLYNKTEGQVLVLDINTLGVLYMLESGNDIHSVEDLAGRTIYLPGKGTTPDYALQYLLAQHGLTVDDVDLEYKSEGTEVIAALAENPDAVGLLPQPAATSACIQNESLRVALDLTAEWDAVSADSSLVTGVTVVRKAFLEENEAAVRSFLAAHEASAAYTNENIEEAAELVADLGIVPKAAIAAKAIPYCNITCITGEEMKTALSGYLQVLEEQNPQSIGGVLPGDDFYYEGK
jgi:NitT/TauT family transport system substrate-binding protein